MGLLTSVRQMQETEERALQAQNKPPERAGLIVFFLFLLVVLGVIISWLWSVGWPVILSKDPNPQLNLGSPLQIGLRVLFSFVIAALSFNTIYGNINKSAAEAWSLYFLAFQNGFFWDSLFNAVIDAFPGTNIDPPLATPTAIPQTPTPTP